MNALLTRFHAGRRALVWLGLLLAACQGGECHAAAAETGAQRPPVWVVGVSPFLEPAGRQEVFQQLVRFLVTAMPLDSSLVVLDAHALRTVARVEIPDRQAFTSEKTRLNQFGEAIRLTKQFLATNHAKPDVRGLSFDSAVRAPQFLDFVADHFVPPDRRVRVILLGSPLYMDEKEPGFSMASGFFPSDGHLLATRQKSVYGVADRERRLDHVTLDWGYFGDPWATDLHRERVQRFWRLFARRQGGSVGAFSSDLPTVFRASLEGALGATLASDAAALELDGTSSKLEMLRITRETESQDWITSDHVRNAAEGPPSMRVGPLKIGIRWTGDMDLDLYARPGSGLERLYFERPRSAEGYYFKDHRTSPEREYEFIEFTQPVDVREVEAWVNLYEGEARGPIEGEVRVEFDGKVYRGRFGLEAREGNLGREGRGQDRWWCRIDVARVLGLASWGGNSKSAKGFD